jgi:hypothetical protein
MSPSSRRGSFFTRQQGGEIVGLVLRLALLLVGEEAGGERVMLSGSRSEQMRWC